MDTMKKSVHYWALQKEGSIMPIVYKIDVIAELKAHGYQSAEKGKTALRRRSAIAENEKLHFYGQSCKALCALGLSAL